MLTSSLCLLAYLILRGYTIARGLPLHERYETYLPTEVRPNATTHLSLIATLSLLRGLEPSGVTHTLIPLLCWCIGASYRMSRPSSLIARSHSPRLISPPFHRGHRQVTAERTSLSFDGILLEVETFVPLSGRRPRKALLLPEARLLIFQSPHQGPHYCSSQ